MNAPPKLTPGGRIDEALPLKPVRGQMRQPTSQVQLRIEGLIRKDVPRRTPLR